MVRPLARDRAARTAPAGTRKAGWLLALGIAAALLFALATLPAQQLSTRLARVGLVALGWSGTVWSGTASGVSWRGARLGDVEWSVTPLSLLRGRVGAELRLARPDGQVQARVASTFGGELHVEGASIDLPIEALGGLPIGLPRGWRGRLRADLTELVVVGAWPTTVTGTLDLDDLVAPPPRNAAVGSYHAILPDPQAGSGAVAAITARVSDKEGPFAVDARLALSPDRSFVLEGTVAPRGETPPAMRRSLELLGPADEAGRRPFSVAGTL
jgi:general secretion pathway protein N